MKPILVTGANGRVGKALVQALLKTGVKVRAIVRHIPDEPIHPQLQFYQADFNDIKALYHAFLGGEKLFSMSPSGPDITMQGRCQIEAAKRAKISFIVRLSGYIVEAHFADLFQIYHLEVEALLQSSQIRTAILRPNTFMQEFIRTHGKSIREEGKIYSCINHSKVSYIDVRDIAAVAACLLLATDPLQPIYQLTGKEALSMQEIASIFTEVLGKSITYVNCSNETIYERLLALGRTKTQARSALQVLDQVNAGCKATITHTVDTILRRPSITFAEFVRDHENAFQIVT